MTVAQQPQAARGVPREWLVPTLAFPFMLLFAASLVAWPWRALDVPGTLGTLTPPSIVLLVLAVAASMYAMQRHLPLAMVTWLPAGQGALVLLTTGFIANIEDTAVGFAVIMAYGLIYLLVLGLAMAVAGSSGRIAIAFVAFFVITQATRFPVFEVDAREQMSMATLFTLFAVLRAVIELAVLIWLTKRLVEEHETGGVRFVYGIVALVVAHGVLAAWEDPLLRGELSVSAVWEQTFSWLRLVTLQLGFAGTMIRVRRSLVSEPRWADSIPPADPAPPEHASPTNDEAPAGPEPEAADETLMHRAGRPTPRRRRRR